MCRAYVVASGLRLTPTIAQRNCAVEYGLLRRVLVTVSNEIAGALKLKTFTRIGLGHFRLKTTCDNLQRVRVNAAKKFSVCLGIFL